MPTPQDYYPNTWLPTPKSPLGKVAAVPSHMIKGIDELISSAPGALKAAGDFLAGDPSQAPAEAPDRAPYPPANPTMGMLQRGNPKYPTMPSDTELSAYSTHAQAPEGQVVSKPTIPGGGPVLGTARYTGPKLNTESALAGLKGAQSTANFSGGPDMSGPSTEELYRHAFGDPNYMAPGAGQMAGEELKTRIGDEDYNQAQQRHQQEMVNNAITAMHPAIQHGSEIEALRKAYPAQAQAQGIIGQAQEAADARIQSADIGAEADQQTENGRVATEAVKGLLQAKDPTYKYGSDELRAHDIQYWEQVINKLLTRGHR